MTKIFGLLACLLLVLVPAYASAATDQQWLVVSDIHFNPLADKSIADELNDAPAARWRAIFASRPHPRFSSYGSDTNFPLLESALLAMRNAVSSPPEIFLTGDFLAHGLRTKYDAAVRVHDNVHYRRFVDRTMRFLADELREAFPRSRLIPVLGNNDSDCGDYAVTPGSSFLARTAATWGASLGATDPKAFVAQFSTGGYYTVPLSAGGATAIVLNDVLWSPTYRNRCGDLAANPGAAELRWFRATLRALKGKPVWVVAHIPPGVDAYASLHAKPPAAVEYLRSRFNRGMIAAMDATSGIEMTLVGHTHMNAFRVIGPDPSRPSSPVLAMPAISPIFGSNPTFAVLRVHASDASVSDAQYFVLDGLAALGADGARPAHWRREFDFDSVYGHGTIDAAHLDAVQQAIFLNPRVRHRYESYYDGGSGRAAVPGALWRAYWCADVALARSQYDSCALPEIQRKLPPQPPAPPAPTATPAPRAPTATPASSAPTATP